MRKLGKIVLATLVGAMILACASCKRDDSSVSGATFKLSKVTMNGVTVSATEEMSMSIKFNADGTCEITMAESVGKGEWTQDGTSVTVVMEGESVEMTVSSDGSILTITIPESEYTEEMTATLTRQ